MIPSYEAKKLEGVDASGKVHAVDPGAAEAVCGAREAKLAKWSAKTYAPVTCMACRRKLNERYKALGAEGFAAGLKRVPALVPGFTVELVKLPAKDMIKAMDAWLSGWDAANVAAPVEGI